MANYNQPFQGCCPLSPVSKPPKLPRLIGPPGPQGIAGPTGPVPQSAFRAENPEPLLIDELGTKVLFPMPIFDINGEYNPGTSTFVPNQSGVYSIVASVLAVPNTTDIDQRFTLIITVDGNPIES